MNTKALLTLILGQILFIGACAPAESSEEPDGTVAAASRLLERVLPAGRAGDFVIEEIVSVEGHDVFELETINGRSCRSRSSPGCARWE